MTASDPSGQSSPRRLIDLRLTVYAAVDDPPKRVVHLRAEAKATLAEGRAGPETPIGLFLNGQRLAMIPTDEFGLAVFDRAVDRPCFCDGLNQLVARTPGFAREAKASFHLQEPAVLFQRLRHRWAREIPLVVYDFAAGEARKPTRQDWETGCQRRREGLVLEASLGCGGRLLPLEGLVLEAHVETPAEDGTTCRRRIAAAPIDAQGNATLTAADLFVDLPEAVTAVPSARLVGSLPQALFEFEGGYRVLPERPVELGQTLFGCGTAVAWPTRWYLHVAERLAAYEYALPRTELPADNNLHGKKVLVSVADWPGTQHEVDVEAGE